jgi:hypothetical protein
MIKNRKMTTLPRSGSASINDETMIRIPSTALILLRGLRILIVLIALILIAPGRNPIILYFLIIHLFIISIASIF